MEHTRDYVSWSEISTWLNCQQQWAFHYQDELIPSGPPSIDLQMGTAAHTILAEHYRVPPEERTEQALHTQADKACRGLVLDDNGLEYRSNQLRGYARVIWHTWGRDEDMPAMRVETSVRTLLPWNPNKAYLCIPDAHYVNQEEHWGIILSHKTRLSSLPDLHTLVHFHQQAPLEAWALMRLYNLQTVFIYINALTPTKAERSVQRIFTKIEYQATEDMLRIACGQLEAARSGVIDPFPRGGPHCYQCEYRVLHAASVEPDAKTDELKEEFRHGGLV